MSDSGIEVLQRLPDVSFIDNLSLNDVQEHLVTRFLERYKQITGRPLVLDPGDPRRLILEAVGVLMFQDLAYVDRAGKQDLIKYSYGEYLDNLAAFWGLTRNPPAPARTVLRFTLSEAQMSAVSIPQGVRATNGANVYFATTEYAEIPAGDLSADVPAVCTTAGTEGNFMTAGLVNKLVDPLPFVASVVNIEETSGGSDTEDDDQLRVRVFLAPASYSTAGPRDAYIQHAKSFSSAIGSVNVSSPVPGDVQVRLLLKDGSMPSQTLCDEVYAYLNDDTIRPLTDHLSVLPPDPVPYEVAATYWISVAAADQAVSIQQRVNAAVTEYNEWQQAEIGRDINPSELTYRMMRAGAKRVVVEKPVFTPVNSGSVARLKTSTVTYGEIEDD